MRIIVDTKEKIPWKFDQLYNVEVMYRHLITGDYSIDGYENVLCIERKKSVLEIAVNITQKRFWNELVRMSKIKHRFIILEFPPSIALNNHRPAEQTRSALPLRL